VRTSVQRRSRSPGAPVRVQSEIDEQVLGAVDEESTEGAAVLDPVDIPATLTGCCEELVPGQPNIAGGRGG
jgi:hypothetical protein